MADVPDLSAAAAALPPHLLAMLGPQAAAAASMQQLHSLIQPQQQQQQLSPHHMQQLMQQGMLPQVSMNEETLAQAVYNFVYKRSVGEERSVFALISFVRVSVLATTHCSEPFSAVASSYTWVDGFAEYPEPEQTIANE